MYEENFAGFCHRFRPSCGQHHGLDAIWAEISNRLVNWVQDAYIPRFFDTLDHEKLMKFVGHLYRAP